MTIREILAQYQEKFPDRVNDKEDFVNKTSRIYFDYYDGVFAFFYEDPTNLTRDRFLKPIYTASGGNNGCMLDEEDYKFVFNNIVLANKDFKNWLEKHNMTDKDLMSVNVAWFNDAETPITDIEVFCEFDFYTKSVEGIETD